jgi:hypothetical protein
LKSSLPAGEFQLLESHQFLDTAERHGRMPAIDLGDPGVAGVDAAQSRRWADANAVFSVNLSASRWCVGTFFTTWNIVSTSRPCR